MHVPPDVLRPVLDAINFAAHHKDVGELATLCGWLACLTECCKAKLSQTVDVTVTRPPNEGHLLAVNDAASRTGLPAGFFYRNHRRIPAARYPSKGRVMFEETALIRWVEEGCRLQ